MADFRRLVEWIMLSPRCPLPTSPFTGFALSALEGSLFVFGLHNVAADFRLHLVMVRLEIRRMDGA